MPWKSWRSWTGAWTDDCFPPQEMVKTRVCKNEVQKPSQFPAEGQICCFSGELCVGLWLHGKIFRINVYTITFLFCFFCRIGGEDFLKHIFNFRQKWGGGQVQNFAPPLVYIYGSCLLLHWAFKVIHIRPLSSSRPPWETVTHPQLHHG